MSYVHQEGIQRMEFPDEITYLRCRTEWLERYSHIYIFAYFVSIGAYSGPDNIVVEISPTFEEIRVRNEALTATQIIQMQGEEAQRIAALPPMPTRQTIEMRYHSDVSAEDIAEYIETARLESLSNPAYSTGQYDSDAEPSGGRTMAEVLSEEQVAYPVGQLITDENGNVLYVSGPDGVPIGIPVGPAEDVEENQEKEVEIKKRSNIKKKSLFDVIDMD